MFFQRLVRRKCDLRRWWEDAQEHLRPVGQHSGYEGVWCSLSCPIVHRPQDPCGRNVFVYLICFGKPNICTNYSNSNSVCQAHWYNVRYRSSVYPPEIVRRDDLVERPVRQFYGWCCSKNYVINHQITLVSFWFFFNVSRTPSCWPLT